eukprot:8979385-Pyramimonas_sp.AAC.1
MILRACVSPMCVYPLHPNQQIITSSASYRRSSTDKRTLGLAQVLRIIDTASRPCRKAPAH